MPLSPISGSQDTCLEFDGDEKGTDPKILIFQMHGGGGAGIEA